ncbi:hypothetical protein Bca101_026381 [Brassica carinata]
MEDNTGRRYHPVLLASRVESEDITQNLVLVPILHLQMHHELHRLDHLVPLYPFPYHQRSVRPFLCCVISLKRN